jgi:hypothetical protein
MKNTLLLSFLLVFFACGGDKKADTSSAEYSAPPATPQAAMNQAEQAIKKAVEQQQPVEPVNFHELKALLPQNAGGFTQTNSSGETAGAMTIKISKAEGDYKDGSGKELRLVIIDTGGMGMGLMGMAAWSSITIDKEDSNGYERTTTLNGYKSFEKFRKNGESSELAVLAENRFVVTATCRGCSMEKLRAVVNAVPLGKLKNMQ